MARILLVEDDPALSRGIIALLKAAGHAADSAKDGETALFLVDSEPCSLVILDIGLPDISGFEVLKRLRARGCKTPILVLTARDHVTDRVKGLDLGADDYLLKPFDAGELGIAATAAGMGGSRSTDGQGRRGRFQGAVDCRGFQLRRCRRSQCARGAYRETSQEAGTGWAVDQHPARTWIHAQGFVNLAYIQDVQAGEYLRTECSNRP